MNCWLGKLHLRRLRPHGSHGDRLLKCWILVWSHSAKRPLVTRGAPPLTSMTLATLPSHHERVGILLPHRFGAVGPQLGQGCEGWTAGWEQVEWRLRTRRAQWSPLFQVTEMILYFPCTNCLVFRWITTYRRTSRALVLFASSPGIFLVCF